MTSPTQRSLKLLRDGGYTVAIVEHWNPHAKIRQDLFGFADLLAIKPGEIIAIQTTSISNIAARRAKISAEPRAATWLAAGGLIELHGWRRRQGLTQWWSCNRQRCEYTKAVNPTTQWVDLKGD